MPDPDDIDALVTQARATKVQAGREQFAGELEREPSRSVAELIAEARAQTGALWEQGGTRRSAQLAWARGMLGPDAPDDAVEDVARRRDTATRVHVSMTAEPGLCVRTRVEGEGTATVGGDGAALLALVHSAPTMATWFATAREAPARGIFGPADVPPAGSPEEARQLEASPRRAALEYHLEALGARWIGRHRRFDVVRRLLEEGEVCGLPINAPGSGTVRFFGRERQASTGLAELARLIGAPVVVIAAVLGDDDVVVRHERPLDPAAFASTEDLHQAIFDTAEAAIGHAPWRLVHAPPLVAPDALAALEHDVQEARRDLDALRAEYGAARTRLYAARDADRAALTDDVAARYRAVADAGERYHEVRRRLLEVAP